MEKASLKNKYQNLNYDIITFHNSHTMGEDVRFFTSCTLTLKSSK
jgi:hypothetical protein